MKNLKKLIIFFVIGIAGLANILTLKNGHNWGGDFSQYILHAQNILSGKSYSADIMLDLPVVYPPGFPLLLAPFIKLFGVNFIVLKSINLFFWYGGIFLLWSYYRKRLPSFHALGLCCFLACSSFFFIYKQNILSDIPFFFAVALMVYLVDSFKDKQSVFLQLCIIFLAACCLLLRSAGLIVFMALSFYFIFVKKNYRFVVWLFLGFLVTLAVQISWIGVSHGFLGQITASPWHFLKLLIRKFPVSFQSVGWFFFPGDMPATALVFKILKTAIGLSAVFLFVLVTVIVFIHVKRRTISFYGCFSYLYLPVLIIWSGFSLDVEDFARFVLPIIGFVGYALVKSLLLLEDRMKVFSKTLAGAFIVLLVILNSFNMIAGYHFNDDVLYKESNQELFSWIKDNTGMNDHFMFWNPLVMRLMTGRIGTAPAIVPSQMEELGQRINKHKIRYVILIKKGDAELISLFSSAPGFFDMVWENRFYKIFKIAEDATYY